MKKYFFIILIILILVFNSIFAAAKSLYWENIAVTAFLDNNGILHISEEQTYIFNGDWNFHSLFKCKM